MLNVCKCHYVSEMSFDSLHLIDPRLIEIHGHQLSHNSIHVTCSNLTGKNDWNGGKGKFKAVIKYKGKSIRPTEKKDVCSFLFSDLDYLTTYVIEVFISRLMSCICHSYMLKSHVDNIHWLGRIAMFSFVFQCTILFLSLFFLGYSHKFTESFKNHNL